MEGSIMNLQIEYISTTNLTAYERNARTLEEADWPDCG